MEPILIIEKALIRKFSDRVATNQFKQSLSILRNHLFEYDTGYRLCYDAQERLAISIIHDPHIHLLIARAIVEINPRFSQILDSLKSIIIGAYQIYLVYQVPRCSKNFKSRWRR